MNGSIPLYLHVAIVTLLSLFMYGGILWLRCHFARRIDKDFSPELKKDALSKVLRPTKVKFLGIKIGDDSKKDDSS